VIYILDLVIILITRLILFLQATITTIIYLAAFLIIKNRIRLIKVVETVLFIIILLSQYVPTRYKVLYSIDKRCRVRNYVQEVRWYIYTWLRGQVCAHVIATLSHNNAQVSAVTVTNTINYKFKIEGVTGLAQLQ
jgi:hypothetical protein